MTDHNLDVNNSYRVELLQEANRLRHEGTLCDVTLRVSGNREFRAHRMILVASSRFFRGVFTNNMRENASGEVNLDATDPSVMEEVLKFIYTGEVDVNSENAKSIVMAADFLMIPSLKDIGTQFLQRSLVVTNCLAIQDWAKEYNFQALQENAMQFIFENFVEVSKAEGFTSLDVKGVVETISDDRIVVSNEEEVYEAVIRWVKHDIATRGKFFEELFKCVRLVFVSKYYLATSVQQEQLVTNSLDCTKLVLEAMTSIALSEEALQKQSPRKCLVTDENVIVCCGGTNRRVTEDQTCCYIPSQNCWKTLQNMSIKRFAHCVAVCDNLLYVCGGLELFTAKTKQCECYNPRLNSWVPVADLPTELCRASAVTFEGQIFVLGGANASGPSKHMYCYIPSINKWNELSSMSSSREQLCCVTLGGFIYAFGGRGVSNGTLTSAEKYNPKSGEWLDIAPMKRKRQYACAAVLNGKALVFGGSDFSSLLASYEVYDPTVNEWSEIADANTAVMAQGIARVGKEIFFFGGKVGIGEYTKISKCFNEEEGEWTMLADVPYGERAAYQCGVLHMSRALLTCD